MFKWIKHHFNESLKESERRHYLSSRVHKAINGEMTDDYMEYDGCHLIRFNNQMEMIESGMLKENWTDEYRDINEFKEWCAENLNGYYKIWPHGNGRANEHQRYSGYWRIVVCCMRQEDAFALRMAWS